MVAYMSADEELERYKQLLGDWHAEPEGEPASPAAPSTPATPPKHHDPEAEAYMRMLEGNEIRRAKTKPQRPQRKQTEGEHVKGSILRLDEKDLVVYRRAVTGQALDMVYSLVGDGTVQIDGLSLAEHKVVEIGHLPSAEMKRLQEEMTWTREQVTKHCYSDHARARIPNPGAKAKAGRGPNAGAARRPVSTGKVSASMSKVMQSESAARVPAELKPKTPVKIRRGQMITIRSKGQPWEAVYWGRDKRGTVVAHRTQKGWALMHLDLNEYKGAMKVSPEPDSLLVDQIADSLKQSK